MKRWFLYIGLALFIGAFMGCKKNDSIEPVKERKESVWVDAEWNVPPFGSKDALGYFGNGDSFLVRVVNFQLCDWELDLIDPNDTKILIVTTETVYPTMQWKGETSVAGYYRLKFQSFYDDSAMIDLEAFRIWYE